MEEEQQRHHDTLLKYQENQVAQDKKIQELTALIAQLTALLHPPTQAPAQTEVRKDQTYSSIAQKGLPPRSPEHPAQKPTHANTSPPAQEQTEQRKKVDLDEDNMVPILTNTLHNPLRTSRTFGNA